MMSLTQSLKRFFIASLILTSAFSATTYAADSGKADSAPPSYIELTPDFIVNYTSSGSQLRYIKTHITLQTDAAYQALIADNMPLVRDALVMFLSSRTEAQVTGAQEREKTREEAAVAVNKALKEATGQEPVKSVLFGSFLTQ